MKRTSILAVVLTAACCPTLLTPDTQKPGALVSVKPVASGGLVTPASWQSVGLAVAPETRDCPQHKAELERALGVSAAEACPVVRTRPAPAFGDGDAEIPVPIAPHCYELGSALIVVQYLEKRTICTEIVGIAVLPRK